MFSVVLEDLNYFHFFFKWSDLWGMIWSHMVGMKWVTRSHKKVIRSSNSAVCTARWPVLPHCVMIGGGDAALTGCSWTLWCHVGVVPLSGSVPAYYREVYEAIRCRTDERVQVEVFQRLLQRTDLSKAVLGQVRGLYSWSLPVGGSLIHRHHLKTTLNITFTVSNEG